MNNNPIGIFDSGIGGLSVLRDIRGLLPHEKLIFIADSAFAPYGNKPLEFIQQRSKDLSRFLLEQGAKTVVVACNTATAIAVNQLREQFNIPIIAMEPGVKPAISATRSGIVGVLATENTLTSQQFTRLLHRYAENVQVISQPCPGLVEQIESGEFDSIRTRQLIEQYTAPLLSAGADTIVLGCTHYPLIRQQIADIIGPNITIIETGQAVAQQVKHVIAEQHITAHSTDRASITCWTSGNITQVQTIISSMFGQAIPAQPLPVFSHPR